LTCCSNSTRATQLDALRGVAVSMVVLHHWTKWGPGIGLGNVGVQLFFVLSGFLITKILLGFRDRYAAADLSLGEILGSFHLSRISRIWPVALLTLSFVFAAGDRFEHRDAMLWHALFASNVLFFERGEFHSTLSHFWSLAVEQQFYLVWPLVVLYVPARRFEAVILALVALAPVSRFALYGAGFTHFAQYNLLPFANLDSLGLGALVAQWSRLPSTNAAPRWRLLRWTAAATVGGLVVLWSSIGANIAANPEQTLYAVAFAWLIAAAHAGIAGPIGRLLSWPPLIGLGVISYGVYAYHMFAPRFVGAALRALSAPEAFQSGVPLFLFSATAALTAAVMSWSLMERPVLSWRRAVQTSSARQNSKINV
jgi:peptidoglycan/LPS O-acetylase OafA/YrhL